MSILLLPNTALAATHIVNVNNFFFAPSLLTINSGDIVRWQWVAGGHTTTSGSGGVPDGLWNKLIDIGNTSFQRTFNSAGSFDYFCAIHGAGIMSGRITVMGGGGNQPPVVNNPGTQNGMEEAFFSVTVFASDPDGDALTMSDLGTTPAWASFSDNGNNSATISGIPNLGDAGTYNQSVRAADASVTDTESFDIVIDPAPIVPVDLTSGGFVPDSVSIPVGYSVRWTKNAGGQHTTTSVTGGVPDGNWDSPLTNGNPTYEHLFNAAGTFNYFCDNHPDDTGVVQVNDTTQVGIGEIPESTYRLFLAPYPNPFSSSTVLAFELEREAEVRIDIFDLGGRVVRNLVGQYPAGRHELRWGGRNDLGRLLANGVYFVRLEVDGQTEVRKIFKTN